MNHLQTTLTDLLFPAMERERTIGQIADHIETHGCYGLDQFGRVIHSSDVPAVVQSALGFLSRLHAFEEPIYPCTDHPLSIQHKGYYDAGYGYETVDQWLEWEAGELPNRIGWTTAPDISSQITGMKVPGTGLNHGKSKETGSHILRTLLLETGRLEEFDGPMKNGMLSNLVNAISAQNIERLRDTDTYSIHLKTYGIHTEQSSKKKTKPE